MSRRTEFTCDRCGEKADIEGGGPRTWLLAALLSSTPIPTSGYQCVTKRYDAEWCDKCARLSGLLPLTPELTEAESPPPPEPTLEDLIRQIVREELPDAQ